MKASTISDNFSDEQIHKHAHIVPLVPDFHTVRFLSTTRLLSLYLTYGFHVTFSGFIISGFMQLILCHSIRCNQSLFFHDTTHLFGKVEVSLTKLRFDFSGAVRFSILLENLHNGGDYLIFSSRLFANFVVMRTSYDLKHVTHY